jgi:hypothetical protein
MGFDVIPGALFDVGAEGEWDNLYNGWPTVVQV